MLEPFFLTGVRLREREAANQTKLQRGTPEGHILSAKRRRGPLVEEGQALVTELVVTASKTITGAISYGTSRENEKVGRPLPPITKSNPKI